MVKQTPEKNIAEVDQRSDEVEHVQEDQDKSLVKRELPQSRVSSNQVGGVAENKDSDNAMVDVKGDMASKNVGNGTTLGESNSVEKLSDQLPVAPVRVENPLANTFVERANSSVEDVTPKAEQSVKIRDLKSNKKLRPRSQESRHSSPLSKSFKALLSRRNSKNSRIHRHKAGVR